MTILPIETRTNAVEPAHHPLRIDSEVKQAATHVMTHILGYEESVFLQLALIEFRGAGLPVDAEEGRPGGSSGRSGIAVE